MGEYFDQIPEKIQGHIRQITKSSGLPDNEGSVEMIARGWLEKKSLFEEQMEEMDMEEVDFISRDDEQASLTMTYSGSLLNIGPLVEDSRRVQYASIGLRQDVPEMAENEESVLSSDIQTDQKVEFQVGPIQSSSPVFKLAVCKGDLNAEEQEEKITKATLILTEEIVEVNKTLESE